MEKRMFIIDDNTKLQCVIKQTDSMLSIRLINSSNELLGFINLFFQPNKRIYLSEIYCYDKYRGNNIASKLSEITDYMLRDYNDYIIRGMYYPTQMSSDFENIKKDKKELDLRARNFYKKNGYEIINYYDFINNQDKYNYLNIEDDFKVNGTIVNNIVFKRIKPKDFNLYVVNNSIYFSNNNIMIKQKGIDILN